MSSLRTFTCVGNLPDCRAQRVGEPYQPQTRKALLNQGWRWSVQVRWRCCWHGVSKYILSVLTKLERVRSVQLNTLLDKRIHAVHARLEEMIIYKGERGGVDISVICGCCLANHAVFFFPNICSLWRPRFSMRVVVRRTVPPSVGPSKVIWERGVVVVFV